MPTHRLAQEGVSVTPQHPPPPSAALLQPKTEPRWLGFGFFTQPPSPPRVLRPHDPTATAAASYVPPCHPHAPSPTPVPHGVPKTEPRRLGFGIFTQTPLPSSCFATAPPPPGTGHRATPMHHLPLPFHAARPGFSPKPPPSSCFATP
jgi:hypothetical protein